MKRHLVFIIVTMFALISCDKDEDITANNCLTIDGELCYKLESSYTTGSVAPWSDGFAWDVEFFEQKVKTYPRWGKKKVLIESFNHHNKEYNNNGDDIDGISIYDIPGIGNLYIPMNQGVYEGGNDMVESVAINRYYSAGYDETSSYHITITLKDGKVIEIKYTGFTYDSDMD